jgi:beta-ureidopropionase / N-carbamoyl-L-amino-acid hydrolase
MSLRVDGARLRRDVEGLAKIGRGPGGGFHRTAYSAADAEARAWYHARCVEAGLELRTDGLGNMFAGTPIALASDVPAVWSGSHIDTVPNGGAYDGAVGTLAALECVRRIAESGVALKRPVRSVVFSDEEGNYGHLLGSLGLRTGYDTAQLEAMNGRDGDRLVDALAGWTWATGSPTDTRVAPGTIDSFVELHIEQGANLETNGVQIGVVTSIVGLSGGLAEFIGRADHAGTTPMTMRKDALLAASRFIVGLPAIAASVGPSSVITTGRISVAPGGANVVPERAVVTLDFRDPDRDRLLQLEKRIRAAVADTAAEHGVDAVWRPDDFVDPVPLDDGVRDIIRRAADDLELSHVDMPSGAGHDSQNIAHLAPTAMIFVPSRDGRSHSPAEFTDFADIENGANVLLATLIALASR